MSTVTTPSSVHSISRAARRAMVRRQLLNRLGMALCVGFGAAAVLLVMDRLWLDVLTPWWIVMVVAGTGSIVWAWLLAVRAAPGADQAAGVLDDRLALDSRLRSALELSSADEHMGFTELAMQDASSCASSIDPRAAVPHQETRAYWYATGVLIACIAIGGWMPQWNTKPSTPKPVPPVRAMGEIDNAAAATEEIAQDEGTPETVLDEIEALNELREELAEGVTNEQEADARTAAQLEQLAEALDESAEDAQAASNEISDSIESVQNRNQAEQEPWDPRVDEFADALREQDFQQAADELDELNDALDSMSPLEREQIAQQLEELANSIEPDEPTPPTNQPDQLNQPEPSEQDSGGEPDLSDAIREQAEQIRNHEQPEPDQQPEQRDQGDDQSQEQNAQQQDETEQSQDQQEGQQDQSQQRDQQDPEQGSEQGEQQNQEHGQEQGQKQSRESGNEQSEQTEQTEQAESSEQGTQQEQQPTQEPGQKDNTQQNEQQEQSDQKQPEQGQEQTPSEQANEQGEQQQEVAQETQDPQGNEQQVQREGEQSEQQMPEQQPGQTPDQQQPPQQTPRPNQSLEERLRELDQQQQRSRRDAENAERLREQAQRLTEPTNDQPEGEGTQRRTDETTPPELSEGGGDGPRDPELEPLDPEKRNSEFVPVDGRDPDATGSGNPIGEWDGPDGEPAPPGTIQNTAQQYRRASKEAQKAIEDQQVPRRHRHLVREVFKKVQERADKIESGTREIAPQAKDADASKPESSSDE